MVIGHDGDDTYWAVVLENGSTDQVAIYPITNGSWGPASASASASFSDGGTYTLKVVNHEMSIQAWVESQPAATCATTGWGADPGLAGIFSNKTSLSFDDFEAYDVLAREPLMPGLTGMADASVSSETLLLNGKTRGGAAIVEGFRDDYFMIQADVDLNSGTYADIWYRFDDVSNGRLIRLESDGDVYQVWYNRGSGMTTGSETYTTGGSIPVKIKLSDSATEVWINGTKEYDWGASSGSGGVAFGGWQAKFDNIKVGYDNNDDDDLDDVGDDLVFSQDFSSTSDTFAYDDAGNLVKDGQFIYTYDAWHRLVTAVSAEDDDITIGTYTYDGRGRRIKKVVTNSGQLDGTELYFYGGVAAGAPAGRNSWQVIEVRDGSENMIRQVVHGTQYIDEVVLEILEDGVAWVHQDANYNVIALTDFASQTLEHTYYTPYGIQTVDQETYWGDADGDGLVTADEWDTDTDGQLDSDDDCWGSNPSGVCRLVDFDFDNDVDATDATRLAELDSATTYRQPGQPYSAVGNTRGHQGLIHDAETRTYSGRARTYGSKLKRWFQRDPLAFQAKSFSVRTHYQDGMSLLEYVASNPLSRLDPLGLAYDPSANAIGSNCAGSENESGPCNVETCCRCGYGKIGLFKTTTTCKCMEGSVPSLTIWKEPCGDDTLSGGPSGCKGKTRPGSDSSACGCGNPKSCCPPGYH